MALDTDLATAALDRLTASAEFQGLVSDGLIGTDAAPAALLPEKMLRAWLFQGLDDEFRPFRDVEGTGRSAVVLASRSDWSGSNRHNTTGFPVLQVLIYTDSTRGSLGEALTRDATQKVRHIATRIDKVFNTLPRNEASSQKWGDLFVHTSVRSRPFSIRDVPGSQTLTVRAELYYETTTD